MTERADGIGQLLSAVAFRFARADRALLGAQRAAHALGEGFFSHALTPSEQTALSGRLYDRTFRASKERAKLMAWERRWFEQSLPPPPGRVLVGAAGAGRECRGLLERGYEVDGFDPSPRAVAHAEARLEGRARVTLASYADLGGPRLAWLRPRYDVVLLGWGSLSHVVGRAERAALMEAVDALVPDGPILTSFYLADEESPIPGRMAGAGRRLGRVIGARRGLTAPEPVRLTNWGGFVREYAIDEIEALARSVGRDVQWHLGKRAMPHVTMRRVAPRA